MTIAEYMNKKSLTYRQFASQCGISASMVYRLHMGERGKQLSLSVAQAIINGSNGEITIDDLLDNFKNGPKVLKKGKEKKSKRNPKK